MRLPKRLATLGVVVGLLGAAGVGPALAATASYGTASKTVSTSTKISNSDTKGDGKFTSGPYMLKSGAEGSLVNKSGYKTTVSKSIKKVKMVKACVSRTALPMACTSWKG